MAGIICPKSSDADNVLLPLNSNLENPNPASKETIRVNTVAAKATTRLLAKDLGMEVSNKTRAKFEKVGVSVKNLGGDMNNSDAGFMEDKNIHTAGKSAARQQIARNTQAQRIPTASSGFILECILDCICFMNPCPSLSHICCTIAQSLQSLQTIQKPQRLLFQNYNF